MTGLMDRAEAGTEVGNGFDEDLVCRAVVPVTHDVRSVVLGSPTGQRLAFDAGQYVTVGAEVDGRRLERCYTISSAPDRTDAVTITVKRVPGGPMSNWLHDRIAPGDRLRVTGPFGRFSTVEHPAANYLFLSAGSGITPLMSMTRSLLDDDGADITFVHSARTPRDIIFRAELDAAAASRPGLRVTAICEGDAPDERWTGARGRLTPQLLHELAPDLLDREVFTCGPRPYRDAVREMLAQAGVEPGRCHEESFTVADPPARATEETSRDAALVVEFRRSGRVVECRPGETLLQAGLRAGVALAASCGEGLCGTCKNTMLAGRVDMQHNGGIRPREIAESKILLCCSTPLVDLVLDA